MNATALLSQRLHTQCLAGTPFGQPEDVVQSLLGVQSQDFPGASWSVGQRVAKGAEANVRQEFDAGRILRTHVLRPTWHFVTPADIRWLVRFTAPRVHALNAHMYRKLELDEETFTRAHQVFGETLAGGNQLTRAELGALLAQNGIAPAGQRLAYIVMHAELETLICSGAMRGKQHTYALLDERAPRARPLDGDEALAELTRRYVTGHGPTTERDLAWWASLTLAQVRRGLDIVSAEFESVELDGQVFWHGPDPPAPPIPPDAYL
ncbi:MAG: winged helix DNA-binding domain-containing protein, partial [Vicinamibacterales bacterium]